MSTLSESFLEKNLTEGIKQFLHDVPDEITQRIVENTKIVAIEAGDTLFEENDEADSIAIVLSGKFRAISHAQGDRTLGEIGVNEIIGDMALISKENRSASVIAICNSSVGIISNEIFLDACKADVNLLMTMTRQIVDRLKNSNANQIKDSDKQVVAIVNLNPQSELVNTAINQLKKENNKSVYLTETSATAANDDSLPCSNGINQYLLRLKEDKDHIFIEINENQEWNHLILGLCDSIHFLAEEGNLPTFRSIKETLDISKNHWHYITKFLTLCYLEGDSPQLVPEWIEHFSPSEIIKIRVNRSADLGRMQRIITGTANCLILSGGGAHGYAHLGALKAFQEKNIPIDVVGGTSFGSVVAGIIARDWPLDMTMEMVKTLISIDTPLNDYTIPITSLIKGNKLKQRLKDHLKGEIENSWINFFCIAADYIHCKEKVFQVGPMEKAIAASVSIPGILPPQIIDQTYYVDGGVLNNVPVDRMAQLYKGKRITVDLSNIKHFEVSDLDIPSSRKLIASKVNPFTETLKVPKLMSVVMKSITMSSFARRDEIEELSDIFINPRVNFGFLDWKRFDPIMTIGYNSTIEVLDQFDYSSYQAVD